MWLYKTTNEDRYQSCRRSQSLGVASIPYLAPLTKRKFSEGFSKSDFWEGTKGTSMANKAKRFLQQSKLKQQTTVWLLWVPNKACFVKHPRKTTHNKCNTQAKINQGTFSTNRRLIQWKMGFAQVKRAYPIDPMGLCISRIFFTLSKWETLAVKLLRFRKVALIIGLRI